MRKTLLVLLALGILTSSPEISNLNNLYSLEQKIKDESFNTKKVVKKINEIDKEYFSNYNTGFSRFYGRIWADYFAKKSVAKGDNKTIWDKYKQKLASKNLSPKRLDCTLYAQEILKAGMSQENYKKLWSEHKKIWRGKGFAGWSVSHLLTKKFNWKAYAIIEPHANNYNSFLTHFKKGEYPVWRQPNTRIENYFIIGKDDKELEDLLSENEFGWGFSQDGIHTWITTGTDLKECHFDGAPSKKYNFGSPILFETTNFLDYKDYEVHLIVFPNKKELPPNSDK